MTELILHNYPESIFSEKIRALLNARQLPWRSVPVSMIMPRPDTIALTGGYRRIPVLQIGADVYCDTALIANYLEDKGSGATLYPANVRLAAQTPARWVDSEMISAVGTLRFQPANLGSFFANAAAAEAFAKDRAQLSEGATKRVMVPLDEALPRFQIFLAEMEAQLSDGRRYVFGAEWTIADFSIYHVLWFIHAGGAMMDVLARHGAVKTWFERMREFGARPGKDMNSSEALQVALQSTPEPLQGSSDISNIPLGAVVDVGPTDYGVMPSRGELLSCTTDEIVIRRHDERTGTVHVHFPRLGFCVRKADT